MTTPSKTLIDLEKKFWQSMVDEDTGTALDMLNEPSLMVSSHGAMKFDHTAYRRMAEQGSMVVKSFELSDVEVVFPNEATAIVTYPAEAAADFEPPSWAARQVYGMHLSQHVDDAPHILVGSAEHFAAENALDLVVGKDRDRGRRRLLGLGCGWRRRRGRRVFRRRHADDGGQRQ